MPQQRKPDTLSIDEMLTIPIEQRERYLRERPAPASAASGDIKLPGPSRIDDIDPILLALLAAKSRGGFDPNITPDHFLHEAGGRLPSGDIMLPHPREPKQTKERQPKK